MFSHYQIRCLLSSQTMFDNKSGTKSMITFPHIALSPKTIFFMYSTINHSNLPYMVIKVHSYYNTFPYICNLVISHPSCPNILFIIFSYSWLVGTTFSIFVFNTTPHIDGMRLIWWWWFSIILSQPLQFNYLISDGYKCTMRQLHSFFFFKVTELN